MSGKDIRDMEIFESLTRELKYFEDIRVKNDPLNTFKNGALYGLWWALEIELLERGLI
ncbi:MAG: hypothetical protein ACI3T9_04160 [Romboutsia timonensis]